jgi:putative glutamine amidotransferase
MTIPLIGVTTARTLNEKGFSQVGIPESYIKALSMAGAYPVLIPLGLPMDWIFELLPRINGVLFSGGGDVYPERYGSNNHPKVSNVDEERDQVEISLYEEVTRREMPFLGICRGLQVINVALGGTLYEDLEDQRPDTLKHDYWMDYPPDYLSHPVRLSNNSRINDIVYMEMINVNSLHHQGIRDLASVLDATAHSPDGLIEAIELPDYPFGLGVQWHPEWLQNDQAMRALFSDFVKAASRGL